MTPKKEYYSFWTLYCFGLLVALFALLPRLDSFEYFYGKYLWAEDGNVFLNQVKDNEIESLRRWHPSGEIKAQFAFPLKGGNTYIKIDPLENIGSTVFKKIEIFCLG